MQGKSWVNSNSEKRHKENKKETIMLKITNDSNTNTKPRNTSRLPPNKTRETLIETKGGKINCKGPEVDETAETCCQSSSLPQQLRV